MRNEALDNQPVFSTVDELIEHFAGDSEILAVCPARVVEGSNRLRMIVLTVLMAFVAGAIQLAGENILARLFANVLTETGLSILIFALLAYAVYRLVRPKSDIFLVTDAGVLGLQGVTRSVHGISASRLFAIPADQIEKYRFSKWRFPNSILRIEERDTHDVLSAVQNRLWNKKYLLGPRGLSLRDALGLLRQRHSADASESWGGEASFVPVHLKNLWVMGAVASAVLAVVALVSLQMGPDLEEITRQGLAAYEQERLAEARALFERAATGGNATAQAHLGQMYEFGAGVEADLAEARRWYEPAAEQGNAMAQSGLGYLLLFAPGAVSGDAEEGIRWLRAAADQNDARAQNNLGVALTANDEAAAARRLFRQAADQGYVMAQRNLADLYYQGRGGSRSYPDALTWYHRAAESGDAVSQRFLGFMYDRGQGTDASYDDAIKWYGEAAAQGDSLARSNIRILTRQRPAREAVRAMELATRASLLEDGTRVLQLRNLRAVPLDIDLTCYRGASSKTISVSIAAFGSEEVGFLEGWTGNFIAGDRCEVFYSGALLRGFSIP